jgi:hypothetical protein
MPNCCPINCGPCYLNTNIILKDDKDCQGIFTFGPDPITIPGPCGLNGVNTHICALNVNVLKNCKDDLKIVLLDDNGCALDTLVLRCSQYELENVEDIEPKAVRAIYEDSLPTGYSAATAKIVKINANNLNLVGEYVSFEETAYYYRRVTQSYLNLWCGAEANGIVCQLLKNVEDTIDVINSTIIFGGVSCNNQEDLTQGIFTIETTPVVPDRINIKITLDTRIQSQFIYSLNQDLLKSRVLALKQLCECGKVCNDQFFPLKTNPCQAFKNCCPRNY